jgi:hypothetical protein
MTDDRFWELVERTAVHQTDQDRQLAELRSELAKLPVEDVASFDAALGRQVERAYRWDIWGAAYVMEGGASDDAFLYFRLWLISKGRRAFESALKDPDNLAGLDLAAGPEGFREFETFGHLARELLAQRRGDDPGGIPGDDTFGPQPEGTPSARTTPSSGRPTRNCGNGSAGRPPDERVLRHSK